MELFDEISESIMFPSLREWIESGRKVVGYTCSFVPPEIFCAADILPYRLRGIEAESLDIANSFYGPYICSFPKCLIQMIGEGKYQFLDGAIITSACDSTRRLDEHWRKLGEGDPEILPGFFHYFDIPFKVLPHAVEWVINEVRKLIHLTEAYFDVAITSDKLEGAIEEYNEGRRLMVEIEALRSGDNVKVSGTDAFAIALAGTVMPRRLFNEALKKLITDLKKKKKSVLDGNKRIMLAGSLCDDRDLIQLVEGSGATVVADNICFGIRNDGTDPVRVDGDPAKALARHYLNASVCPRFLTDYDARLKYLKEKALKAKVDGVIFENIRFCDMHGSQNSILERDFDQIGIPAMCLEREYGPLNETGRIQMRIDAFLEQL